VQIPPHTSPYNATQPVIVTIGSVAHRNIDVNGNGMTLPDATFVGYLDLEGNPVYADPWWPQQKRPCPFGGDIYIIGPAIGQTGSSPGDPSQYQYRVMYRLFGDTSDGAPVFNPFSVSTLTPSTYTVSYLNTQGYFYFSSQNNNIQNLLSRWTAPDIALYQIRLEVAIQTSASVTVNPTYDTIGWTDWYNVQVNNGAKPIGPKGNISFTNEPICGNFPVGTQLDGTFWAVCPYFYQYSIGIVNSALIPNSVEVEDGQNPGPTEVPGPPSPGEGWSLDTTGATPCGYVIVLGVCDLTIYESYPYGRYCISIDQGFCLSPPVDT
jgi:hypothetical protein